MNTSESRFSYEEAAKFVQDMGEKSTEGADVTQAPFFAKTPEEGKEREELGYKMTAVNKLLEDNPSIPHPLQCLYKVIGDPEREYYFGNWSFFSLNKLIERKKICEENNQNRMIDFALVYGGMGHVVVCSIDPQDAKIFYRHDGGSNGWERAERWEKARGYIPKEEHKHPFQHWLNEVNNSRQSHYNNLVELPLIEKW